MLRTVSTRIPDELYQALEEQVAAGCFSSRSRAVAYYLRRGMEEPDDLAGTLRRIIREELARVQLAPATEPKPDNPKRAQMLSKVIR